MKKSMWMRLGGAVALASALAFAPLAAQAVSWGTLDAKYGTEVRAQAYGSFTNSGYVYARADATFRTNTANKAYVLATWQWWLPNTTGQMQWSGALGNSMDTTSKSFVSNYVQTTLHSGSSQARAVIKVCEQTDWWVPDVCSPQALPSFSY